LSKSEATATLTALSISLVLLGVACVAPAPVLAQTANFKSVDATAATPVELSYHASAHKDCTPAGLPTVRVIEPPKSGVLTVRRGTLSTDKVAACPKLKVPAEVVFYQANAGYQGPDHVKYEVINENGENSTYDMAITVKASPVASPTTEPKKARDL
jgi:hypothetical protein